MKLPSPPSRLEILLIVLFCSMASWRVALYWQAHIKGGPERRAQQHAEMMETISRENEALRELQRRAENGWTNEDENRQLPVRKAMVDGLRRELKEFEEQSQKLRQSGY
jgi:hypothetical protein